jgi:hypothetical protein
MTKGDVGLLKAVSRAVKLSAAAKRNTAASEAAIGAWHVVNQMAQERGLEPIQQEK